MDFSIAARFYASLECPEDHRGREECAGAGLCDRSLGRCDCEDGKVMDDCGADGVLAFVDGHATKQAGNAPPIPVDGWAYWSVPVGCADRTLQVSFSSKNAGGRPKLVLRKGRLPLMVRGANDYYDYYDGDKSAQRIWVSACVDAKYGCKGPGCCMNPMYPGTAFATGAPARMLLAG